MQVSTMQTYALISNMRIDDNTQVSALPGVR